jgi:PHD/YefM family antitoxin component YafN of YafNO toxin-antitoxin module
MPRIQSSTDLRNNYNDISTFCHEHGEAVFITKNGQGDLAVMSIENYERLAGRLELYALLDAGEEAVRQGRKRPLAQIMAEIREELAYEAI